MFDGTFFVLFDGKAHVCTLVIAASHSRLSGCITAFLRRFDFEVGLLLLTQLTLGCSV